jgi:hypothetical protein
LHKYADDLVLLAEEERVIHGMTESGRHYGVEMNGGKTKVMKISRGPSAVQIMKGQKQLENTDCFNCLGSITKYAKYTREIKCVIVMANASFNKKTLFTRKFYLNLTNRLVKWCIWGIALYDAKTWTFRRLDQKYLESFEMWYCRRMKKISWTDWVRNKQVLRRAKEERNILHTTTRNANLIGHTLRGNCLLQHIIEGKIYEEVEVTRRKEEDVSSCWVH